MPLEAKPLFRPDVLREHLERFQIPPRLDDARAKLAHWAQLLRSGRVDRMNERVLLPDFLTDIFIALLGYEGPPGRDGKHTLSREQHVEVDGQFADAVLGQFGGENPEFVVVVEGKGPTDPLERPFGGRGMSAVDQGYRYAINLRCDWIIITSIRQIRLYYKGADQQTYERFDTEKMAFDAELLKRFVYLLGRERVLPERGGSHLNALFAESLEAGQDLTKKFYVLYANMRHDDFDRLREANLGLDAHTVLTATQRLLDRVLFCAFAEDRGLLPRQSLKRAYQHRNLYDRHTIWQTFRSLFRSINEGNPDLEIARYNGGLFANDPVIDSLVVPDEVCTTFYELGRYNYGSAEDAARAPEPDEDKADAPLVDVDILGHIFEQSISDLERLRNELDGRVPPESKERHKTRRKREGAFYTPTFITRYIVEQALVGILKERFEALRQRHHNDATRGAKSALENPRVYERASLRPAQLKALETFWDAWQAELGTVRLLDPACGSGAFLIEAFDQLYSHYERANDRLAELRGQRQLFDLDKHILQHNLYGVDVNEEAIEICRLSLWIKTAQRGKVLTSLDHSIRVGNSVVTDTNVHPLGFDWAAAFPEVAAAGGFDVVVGNPPYIRSEWIAQYKPHWEQSFVTYDGTADIFTYFYERAISLLRDGGKLGFITSGSWIRGNFGAPLRRFIVQNALPESIIDFGEYQPFEDAEMIRPTITVLRKGSGQPNMRLFKWLTSGKPPTNLSEVIAQSPTLRVSQLSEAAWELESDDVIALRRKLATDHRTLQHYPQGRILRGVLSGLTEAFVLDERQRESLITSERRSAELIKPFAQGTHLRPHYVEDSRQFLLAIRSSGDFTWPWSNSGDAAENVFKDTYPAVYEHLLPFRDSAIRREDQGRFWWELRACGYWDIFDAPKIVWPDISKLPRFSMDNNRHYLGNTGYTIPLNDYYLLGVLSSWATWFYISKTAQPLRLRGDRWQYRLFTQYMKNVPIPDAPAADRRAISDLARRAGDVAGQRYRLEEEVRHRLHTAFGEDRNCEPRGKLNKAASAWWDQTLMQLGAALKESYSLEMSPFASPRTADEWERYLNDKTRSHTDFTNQLATIEAELNSRVYRLFQLTDQERALLEREVEH